MSEAKFVSVSSSMGSYNWADPGDKQVCYRFRLRDGTIRAFIVPKDTDLDVDQMEPLEVAEILKSRIDRYLINSDKPKIAELVEILKPTAAADYVARREHQINLLRKRIAVLEDEIATALEEVGT